MFSGAPFKILANAVDAAAFKFDSEKREALRKNSIYQKTPFFWGMWDGLCLKKSYVLIGHFC